MTLMLTSVANRDEAILALDGGADVIDIDFSVMGFADYGTARKAIRAIVSRVAEQRPLCGSLGALSDGAKLLADRAHLFRKLKICQARLVIDKPAVLEAPIFDEALLRRLAGELDIVGVLAFDKDFCLSPLEKMKDLGFSAAMLNLLDPSKGGLKRALDTVAISRFCEACRDLGLQSWLGGALEPPDIPRLLLVKPDVLCFRPARWARDDSDIGQRSHSFAHLRQLIPRVLDGAVEESNVDWRLLTRDEGAVDLHERIDRIFVRDFTMLAQIGAYSCERARPQRVRFQIDAHVRRAANRQDDIHDIFSYDVIMDAIRLVVNAGHVEFVETLAERVAHILLSHTRVVGARICVEKLDVIDGAVGVEIERWRQKVGTITLESAARPRPICGLNVAR